MSITLSAPSRIHFGLFSVGEKVSRQFGGIGVMVQSPGTRIEVKPASSLRVCGHSQSDCRKAIEWWVRSLAAGSFAALRTRFPEFPDANEPETIPASVDVIDLPPRHCGLGSGTQLALGTAAALNHFFELTMPGPDELAASVNRGKRSAIGTYGFFQGGLLIDRGKTENESIAPLDFRTDFPEHWPIMIVVQKEARGLSGEMENAAFEKIPDSTDQQRQQMVSLVRDGILPAVMEQDYDRFGNAVYEFGRQSGLLFKAVQGGPYQSADVEKLVRLIRHSGVSAVGQSSWGPAVFAVLRSKEIAPHLREQIEAAFGQQFEITLTEADNQGFVV